MPKNGSYVRLHIKLQGSSCNKTGELEGLMLVWVFTFLKMPAINGLFFFCFITVHVAACLYMKVAFYSLFMALL